MIEVVDHDPAWSTTFERLCKRYRALLAQVPVVAIEHVGSTAVPGLAAKPVIDVDIVVHRHDLSAATSSLQAGGLEPLGERGIRDRFAFGAPAGWVRTNTYLVVAGSVALRNHLAVRDRLRADAVMRDRYGALKRRLATETDDIDVYVDGKSALIQEILGDAGLGPDELAEIEDANRAPS